MDLEFEKWQKLTDEYAQELSAMQRGDLRARDRVKRLAAELLRLSPSPSDALIHPSQHRRAPAGQRRWFGLR